MKTLIATAFATGALAVCAPAFAQQTYGSLGYSNVEVGPFGLDAVTAQAGITSSVFGVEGEVSMGVGSDRVGVNRAKLNHEAGIFGTARAQLTPDFALTGRAGFATAEAEINGIDADDDGGAYGVGAQWTPGGGSNGLRLDWTRYDFGAGDNDAWTLGFMRKF